MGDWFVAYGNTEAFAFSIEELLEAVAEWLEARGLADTSEDTIEVTLVGDEESDEDDTVLFATIYFDDDEAGGCDECGCEDEDDEDWADYEDDEL